jgi:hypothetical protein
MRPAEEMFDALMRRRREGMYTPLYKMLRKPVPELWSVLHSLGTPESATEELPPGDRLRHSVRLTQVKDTG